MKASEIESLLALANETAVWAAEHEAKQAGVKAHEDPAVKSVSIRNKAEKLDRELVYLIRRYNARPKVPRSSPFPFLPSTSLLPHSIPCVSSLFECLLPL